MTLERLGKMEGVHMLDLVRNHRVSKVSLAHPELIEMFL